MKLIYTAQSKLDFFCRDAVCAYVLNLGEIPLNPFRVFDYFLGGRVPEDLVRSANAALIERCDEVWAFGHVIADGVLSELHLAREMGKPIRLFTISHHVDAIVSIDWKLAELELGAESGGLSREEFIIEFGDGTQ